MEFSRGMSNLLPLTSYLSPQNESIMAKPLVETKARVGVFSIALQAYLPQFPQLVPNFEAQYEAFKKTLPDTIEIIDGGMVTTKEQSMAAGDKFRAADVDLVILQMLTYCTSYNMLPAVRDLDVPVVIVNLQKKLAPDYAKTDIPTWLGDLYACGAIGEMVADLNRAGKRSAVITGVVEGGDPGVQSEIEDWCRAAQVRRRFRDTNIAQIGRPYPGMMDLYIDETNLYHRMFVYTKHRCGPSPTISLTRELSVPRLRISWQPLISRVVAPSRRYGTWRSMSLPLSSG